MGEEQAGEAVDFAILEGFAGGDKALVREVLSVFCAEALEWAGRLKGDGWREVVHTMKGTARTIGADGLGDLCERAENGEAQVLPQIGAELIVVLEEIADYLARR